jgi:hypothetical protein
MFNTSATIGEKILNSCTSLNKIYIPITATQIPTINSNAFQGCPNTSSCTIYAPSIDLGNAFKAAANNYLNN